MFPWHQLFIASYVSWIAMEIGIGLRDRRKTSGTSGDRGSLILLIATFFIVLTGAWIAAAVYRWAGFTAFRFPIFLIGLTLIWAGMALRLWAIRVLGQFFRTTVIVQDQHRLVETGPYRLLRHPSYTGTLLTILGIGLCLGNWISLALVIAGSLIAYGYRIAVEERALRLRFGAEYDAYARDRWRLIPFLL
jgi:protein-S-isoprenylcysteine O-methyltransferase